MRVLPPGPGRVPWAYGFASTFPARAAWLALGHGQRRAGARGCSRQTRRGHSFHGGKSPRVQRGDAPSSRCPCYGTACAGTPNPGPSTFGASRPLLRPRPDRAARWRAATTQRPRGGAACALGPHRPRPLAPPGAAPLPHGRTVRAARGAVGAAAGSAAASEAGEAAPRPERGPCRSAGACGTGCSRWRRRRRGSGMTLKSGRSASPGSMRTALSDLYLEHLLQNRAKPEVRGGWGASAGLQPRPAPAGPRHPPSPSPPGQGGLPGVLPLPCGPAAQRPAPAAPGDPPSPHPSCTRTGEPGP